MTTPSDGRPSVLAVIPARGGSKGLARKNVLDLGGKPLLAWTVEAALASRLVDRVVVSTDDPEIADVAKRAGAETPFMRPSEFADDMATSEVVLVHAVEWLEAHEGAVYDILLYLQVTDPFREQGIIDRVVAALIADPDLDTVFAAKPEHKNYWTRESDEFRRVDERGHLPRQIKREIWREDTGIACASRIDVIRAGRRIGDKVSIIPHERDGDFVDIHSEFDLAVANLLITNLNVAPNQ